MATKVYKVDNQLRIEDTVYGSISYGNAGWYEITKFTDLGVVLGYHGRASVIKNTVINFEDFLDNTDTNLSTETTISDYLAPLIG